MKPTITAGPAAGAARPLIVIARQGEHLCESFP
jgi:hypothetical protein